MNEKIDYKTLIEGNMPPWVRRFVKKVGKGINDFEMIQDKDRVLIGISGGKDSLALALALSLRIKWLPIHYNMKAVMINWIEHPIPEENIQKLEQYFQDLNIEFVIKKEQMFPTSFKDDFNCYLCSRNKRRILFEIADSENYKTIAMGHHLDDLVETSMMNLYFRANFSTMLPVQSFFDEKLFIVRPMIEVKEQAIQRLVDFYNLPVIKPVCPYDQTNIRSRLKPIIKEINIMDKNSREHVFNAHNFTYKKPHCNENPI
ncbi:MAG: ATP-binding protein [Sphaerochaetaceae bacterium]|nr:ATP-binding protein [Sphaerochaetaceae bacterium]